MSKENAPNPEANLGKSFEKFMRKNTLPNPIDWMIIPCNVVQYGKAIKYIQLTENNLLLTQLYLL